MAKKIDKKYWEGLRKFEQEYIKQRADVQTIRDLKVIINTARKLHPTYTKIYGKGFIELPNGELRVWSGEDTRKFHKVVNGLLEFD